MPFNPWINPWNLWWDTLADGSFIPITGCGLEHEFYDFPYIGNVMIPTDELTPSFFREVGQPPTR
jgi:hypothetical protein